MVEDLALSYCEGDKVTMVHGGGNKTGRFLEVSALAEGGRKGVIWLPEGRYGQGWRRFAGELQEVLTVQDKLTGSLDSVVSTTVENILGASSSDVTSGRGRSFVDALRSTASVEVKAKGSHLSSSYLDLFPMSTYFKTVSDGDGLRSTVDCFAMEGLHTPLAAAVVILSLKKKKGNSGNQGIKRLLGHFHSEVDWVLVGLFSKPKHRRKRVGILGQVGSGLELESSSVPGLGNILDPGLDMVSDPIFCSNSIGGVVSEPEFCSKHGCLQVPFSSVSSPSGDLSGHQVSWSKKYVGNAEGVSVNSAVPRAAALGVRLRAESEVPRVQSMYKQTLKYYQRAREARDKPVNKILLLKEVEALEAHPMQLHSLLSAGFIVQNPLVATAVIGATAAPMPIFFTKGLP